MPDTRLIVAHAGGVIPYLRSRIATYHTPSALVLDGPDLRHPIEHYLDNLYVDTVSYDAAVLDFCYRSLGAARMLYATDHPFGAYGVAAGLLEQVPCSGAERDLVYHGNAERLFHLA
jgi:predicted TIM-barrel fold metal-dependent hydrolase